MKKFISVLLIFLLVFGLCACKDEKPGNNDNPPVNPQNPSGGNETNPDKPNPGTDPTPFDRESAITGPEDSVLRFITDATVGDVPLTRITLSSYPNDAETLLDLAYQALASVYSKANVSAIYAVPLGLAGQYSSFDPVLIQTDNESFNQDPLFMIPLQDDDGYTLIGSFFAGDVDEKDYIGKCEDAYKFFINTLLSKNGLLDKNIWIQFNGEKLNRLELKPASNEFIDLYEEANGRILDFFTGNVFSDEAWQSVDEDGRCKVDLNGMKSMADLKKWLGEYFTEDVVDRALNETDSYVEKDGALWAYPAGVGDNMSVEDYRPKFMAQKDDATMVLIVELNRIEFDESWDSIKSRHFEEYYFELTKTPQGWKFSEFKDIYFGFM